MEEKKGWATLSWWARHFLWCSWQVSLYCAGFPCTPFSMLHYDSELSQDPNARQMLKVISNCHVMKPGVSWFELELMSNYDRSNFTLDSSNSMKFAWTKCCSTQGDPIGECHWFFTLLEKGGEAASCKPPWAPRSQHVYSCVKNIIL